MTVVDRFRVQGKKPFPAFFDQGSFVERELVVRIQISDKHSSVIKPERDTVLAVPGGIEDLPFDPDFPKKAAAFADGAGSYALIQNGFKSAALVFFQQLITGMNKIFLGLGKQNQSSLVSDILGDAIVIGVKMGD